MTASVDFGRLVRRRPSAVVRPRSAGEVGEIVRAAAADGVPVAARGRGHPGYGQALTDGVVVDMSALAAVHEVAEDLIVVDAGAGWDAVLAAAWERGRTAAGADRLLAVVGGRDRRHEFPARAADRHGGRAGGRHR
ncbi:FAD-binding protein [Amycolatopsis methanolica]|uniref:FAD-binding protein n=1 Tax=Amycolatopsis methanolica TaxID=1814 RepID=UPI0034351BFC